MRRLIISKITCASHCSTLAVPRTQRLPFSDITGEKKRNSIKELPAPTADKWATKDWISEINAFRMTTNSFTGGCFCTMKNKSRAILFHFNMSDQIVPSGRHLFPTSYNDFGNLDKSFRTSRGIGKHKNLPWLKTIDTSRWYQTPKLFFDTLS